MRSLRSNPKRSPELDWTFEAIGTAWEITTPEVLPAPARERVGAEIDRIDRYWSRFRADSEVAEMARAAGRYPVADADRPLLDWYHRLYELTGSAVNPLVGQILSDAGYDSDYSLNPTAAVSPAPRWEDVIDWSDGVLTMGVPALLDVGAAGKGFAVDRVAAVVAEYTDSYIVDAGGDMVISERETPVRIALEHPLDATKAIGVVELTGGALCASAPNRRAWADWHHIVDPRSAAPTWEVLATWVTAPDAMTADGVATALFFTPAPGLRQHLRAGVPGHSGFDVGHVTLRRNGSVEHTALPGLELFL